MLFMRGHHVPDTLKLYGVVLLLRNSHERFMGEINVLGVVAIFLLLNE
jgi:hypothetical protein